jgi:CO/xanthine dehydrogenase FAD-binding subunit
MKPARFAYHAPDSLEEALRLAHEYGDEQKILAGGQSLIPMMNLRLARPERLVDLNGVQELSGIERSDGGGLIIRAMTRQSEVKRSALVADHAPLLAEALRFVGHQHTRNRGTAVGSIVHADPSAEIPTVWLAHGGRVVLESTEGRREVEAADFLVSHYMTDIGDDEVAVAAVFDPPPPGLRYAFEEISKRHGDFGMLTVAVVLGTDEHRVVRARIVLGAAGDRPMRALAAEKLLEQGAGIEEVAASVVQDIHPLTDVHATADYRRKLAPVLTRRAIQRAMAA